MELRTVDPRTLKTNPSNPRRTKAGKFSDDQMLASIKASGLLQPPLVREDGEDLVILFGHRRVAACVKLKMDAIPVLVKAATEANDVRDSMGAVSENVIRAEMGQVDRWRAMEALATAGWNEAAIAEALGMTARNIAQARLLANICPGMLDQMSLNDLPDQRELRVIAAASQEEQAQVWKKYKPKRGNEASWGEITHALSKVRLRARDAKFGDAEAQAFGIVWQDDLFGPADEDNRSTTQVDAFLGAQTAWLEANLRKGECIVEADEWGRAKLPKGAHQHWGRPGKGVLKAYYIEPRTGVVRETAYTMPSKKEASPENNGSSEPIRKPRPDLTAKGAAIVGDLRTDALHQALREKPISDDQFIAMLVLALAGRNVTVMSGVAGQYRSNTLSDVAATLTEGGVLTRDMGTIRQAARWALVQVLSCRENQSASGLGARHAGTAIDADAFLPNMATEEFLPALSRAALEQCAAATEVTAQARVKDTRAALVAKFVEGTFIYPGARFAMTRAEVEANAVMSFEDKEGDRDLGDGENEGTGGAEDGAGADDDSEPTEGDEDEANASSSGLHAAQTAVSNDHAAA
jgi:ParB family transcriptional regulator, chromosome partitioning protein